MGRWLRLLLPVALLGCGGGGGHNPGGATAGTVDPRNFFPVFAYVTTGGWDDHVTAARAVGIAPEQYPDHVCSDLAAHGFNVAWLNNIDFSLLPSWLAAARRHGLKIVAQGLPVSDFWDGSQWPWPSGWEAMVDRDVKPFYAREAPRFRGDPTLLFYVIQEENPPQPAIFAKMREVMDVVSAADPTHPAIALYNGVDSVRMAADRVRPELVVFGVGPFPAGGRPDQTRYFFPYIIEQSHQLCRSADIPMWVLTQGSDFDVYVDGRFVRREADRPTRAQIRWETWSALLFGAKGIGYFLYHWPFPIPPQGAHEDLHGLVTREGRPTEIYEEAAAVSRALDPIKPLLLRLDGETRLDSDDYHGQIRTAGVRPRVFVHRDTRERYLMLVNYDFDLPRSAIVPAELGSSRFQDVRTGQTYTAATIGGWTLAAGDGALLRLLP